MMKRGGAIQAMRKGPWTPEEDKILLEHVRNNGARNWSLISFLGLLPRTGKSCRLRWVNKLRPGLKKGRKFTPDEEQRVIELQSQFGNRWATIAKYFPGRTDNDVKNFWSIHRKRMARDRHSQQTSLLSISDQAGNLETKAVSVASLQELHASEEGEAQGSNSKGNSNSATSSAVPDTQPDVNPTLINPNLDELPQLPLSDTIFDLPPLPEIHLLQPAPGSVNLRQGQYPQPTQFFEVKPEVGSTDLGHQAQCSDPKPDQFLKWEHVFPDSGLGPSMDTIPLFSPLPSEFDDLAYMLDSFEPAPPSNKFPR